MSREIDQIQLENNLNKTAAAAFFWNHGQFLASTVILGLTTYTLAKYLAPHNYGIYSAVMAFGSLAATCISFGFEGALNVQLPRLSNNMPKIRYLFQKMLKRRVIFTAVFFLLVLLLNCVLKDRWLPANLRNIENYLNLAILCGIISLVSGLVTHVLITLFKVKYFSVVRISFLTVSLLIYIYLLKNGFGIKEILWTTIVISSSAMAFYILGCRDLLTGVSRKFSLKKAHKLGLIVWINNIVGNLLGKELDIILLSLYGISAVHIGFYQLVFILTSYVRMVVNKGMTGILLSAFSSAYKNGGIESLRKWWMISMKFQILVVSPGVLLLVLFARYIFEAILPNYDDATTLLQVNAAFVFIITVLGGGTHITAFYAIGKEKVVLISRTVAGFSNLALDLILIYFYGVSGAIIATGVAGVIVGFFELSLTSYFLHIKYPLRFLINCILCLSFATLIASQIIGEGLLRLIFSSGAYFAAYLFAAWIVKPFEGTDIAHFRSVNRHLSTFLLAFSRNSKAVF